MKFAKLMKMPVCALAVCALFASCIDDNEDQGQVYTQTLPGTINAVFEPNNNVPTYNTGVGYELSYNFTTFNSDVTLTSFALNGNSYPTLEFKNLPWTAKDGWRNISAQNAQPSATVNAPTFQKVEIDIYDRMVTNTTYYPCLNLQFVLNGYTIYGFPSGLINIGQTTVTDVDGNVYVQSTDERSNYIFTLYSNGSGVDLNNAANRKASLTIENAKFASGMPAMNMCFTDLPFDVLPNGKIQMIKEEDFTPSLVSSTGTLTPYSGATIKDFNCLTDAKNNMTLTFTCEITIKDITASYQTVVICTEPASN